MRDHLAGGWCWADGLGCSNLFHQFPPTAFAKAHNHQEPDTALPQQQHDTPCRAQSCYHPPGTRNGANESLPSSTSPHCSLLLNEITWTEQFQRFPPQNVCTSTAVHQAMPFSVHVPSVAGKFVNHVTKIITFVRNKALCNFSLKHGFTNICSWTKTQLGKFGEG